MIRSARQRRDKIKNMAAAETGARKTEKAQALLRIFMMERFLERIAVSEYRDRFIAVSVLSRPTTYLTSASRPLSLLRIR